MTFDKGLFPSILTNDSYCLQGSTDRQIDRSESVRYFQNFVGPGPVQSQVLKFFLVLGPGPTGFGPWIPDCLVAVGKIEKINLLCFGIPHIIWPMQFGAPYHMGY